MKQSIRVLLDEALRRNALMTQRDKNILSRWLGLGTEAEYRPAIKEGLMVFWDKKVPPPRCMGWLCLTEKGVTILLDYIQDCKLKGTK